MEDDPTFAGEQTLESFVERAFIGLMTQTNPHRFLELLESREVAEHTVDLILRSLPAESLQTVEGFTKEDLYPYIDQIVSEYDGFDPRMMLSVKLAALIGDFPMVQTFGAIQDKKPKMVEKIHKILKFLVEKKRRQHETNGIKRFIDEEGRDVPNLRGAVDESVAINRILIAKKSELDLVLCGNGDRFKAFRVKARNPEVGWDHTGLVVKSMKQVRGGKEAQDAVFGIAQKEHQLVGSIFNQGRVSVPKTHFLDQRVSTLRDYYHHLGPNVAFQEHVVGEPISVAMKDPAMKAELGRAIRDLVIAYEATRNRFKKVLDCDSIHSGGVLASRMVSSGGGSRVQLNIVSTNDLVTNRPSDPNAYLDKLRQLMT